MDEKKCKWLNTSYGVGCYICLWELKPIGNADRCKTCKNHTEKGNEDE
jgi:hypothetical protein